MACSDLSALETQRVAAKLRFLYPAIAPEIDLDTKKSRSLTIGRSASCGLCLGGVLVSRCHCRLTRNSEGWLIEDCASRNGTFVNGRRIAWKYLSTGDLIELGGWTVEFELGRN